MKNGDTITEIVKKVGNEYNYVRKIIGMIEERGYIKTEKITFEFNGKSNRIRGKARKVIFIDTAIKQKAESLAETLENNKTGYEELDAYKEFVDLFIGRI